MIPYDRNACAVLFICYDDAKFHIDQYRLSHSILLLEKTGHIILVMSQWRHGVSNHRQIDCSPVALFRQSARFQSCAPQWPSNAESVASSWHNYCIDFQYFFYASKNEPSVSTSGIIVSEDRLMITSLDLSSWISGRGINHHEKSLTSRDKLSKSRETIGWNYSSIRLAWVITSHVSLSMS